MNSKILSGADSLPAGCLLRTNSWIPASADGIMVSVISSFGPLACAAPAKALATRHARDIRKNLLVIEVLPGHFVFYAGACSGRSPAASRAAAAGRAAEMPAQAAIWRAAARPASASA